MCACACVCVLWERACMCACACVHMCVHMRVYEDVCMVQWFVQSISNQNIVGAIPAECSYTRLSSPSLSLGGYQQPNVYD